jgi:hypothetical protein
MGCPAIFVCLVSLVFLVYLVKERILFSIETDEIDVKDEIDVLTESENGLRHVVTEAILKKSMIIME